MVTTILLLTVEPKLETRKIKTRKLESFLKSGFKVPLPRLTPPIFSLVLSLAKGWGVCAAQTSVTTNCSLPAVCEEAAISVSGAITAGGGAGGPLCLEGLPVEGRAVQETLFLSAGRQRTPVGAAVRGVLPTDVAQAVAAGHGASAGSRGKEGNKEKDEERRAVQRKRKRGSVEARQ